MLNHYPTVLSQQVVKADDGAQSATALMPFAYLYFFQKVTPTNA